MFQSTLSCLIIQLIHEREAELRGTVQFVISAVQCEFHFTVCDSQGDRQCSLLLWCGSGQSFTLPLTNIWVEIKREGWFLTSLSCLPPRHCWEKSLTFPQWGWKCVWTSGSFPSRPQTEARPSAHNQQEKLSVIIPADQTAFTFQWLFPRRDRYIYTEYEPRYQPANRLSYQPDEFYVENNVCY